MRYQDLVLEQSRTFENEAFCQITFEIHELSYEKVFSPFPNHANHYLGNGSFSYAPSKPISLDVSPSLIQLADNCKNCLNPLIAASVLKTVFTLGMQVVDARNTENALKMEEDAVLFT